MATQASANTPPREVPTYDIHEFHPRQSRYVVLIPVLEEGERILNQLRRMEFLRGKGDIVIGDGGSKDTTGDPKVMKNFAVRTLLVKTAKGKQSAQLRMLLDYATDQGYEGFVLIDGNGKDGVEAAPNFFDAMDQGFDYIQGSRFVKGGTEENTPWDRKLAAALLHAPLISLAAGFRYTDTTNGFRALTRRVALDPADAVVPRRVPELRNAFLHGCAHSAAGLSRERTAGEPGLPEGRHAQQDPGYGRPVRNDQDSVLSGLLPLQPEMIDSTASCVRWTAFATAFCAILILPVTLEGLRGWIFPDSISYFDMASGAIHGSASVALFRNGYWSPAYPAILAVMMAVARPSPAGELQAVYVVQWLLFVVATVCSRQVAGDDDAMAAAQLMAGGWSAMARRAALLGFAYALFLLVNMNRTLWFATPDMLLQALVYLSAACALGLYLPGASWKGSAALGLALGVGYLAKAAMFPVALLFWSALSF